MTRGIAYGLLFACPLLLAAISNEPPRFRVIEEQRIGAFDKRGRLRLSRAEQRRMAA